MNNYVVKQYIVDAETDEVYDFDIITAWDYPTVIDLECAFLETYQEKHPDRNVKLGKRLYIDWATRRDDVRLVQAIELIKQKIDDSDEIVKLLTYGRNYNIIKQMVIDRENYLKN